MKELWTATVEVLTPPTDSGNTKAFTNVVTWASDAQEYATIIASVFEGYGWSILGIEECRSVSACHLISEPLSEMIERARDNPNACVYGTFHYYPSRPA